MSTLHRPVSVHKFDSWGSAEHDWVAECDVHGWSHWEESQPLAFAAAVGHAALRHPVGSIAPHHRALSLAEYDLRYFGTKSGRALGEAS